MYYGSFSSHHIGTMPIFQLMWSRYDPECCSLEQKSSGLWCELQDSLCVTIWAEIAILSNGGSCPQKKRIKVAGKKHGHTQFEHEEHFCIFLYISASVMDRGLLWTCWVEGLGNKDRRMKQTKRPVWFKFCEQSKTSHCGSVSDSHPLLCL